MFVFRIRLEGGNFDPFMGKTGQFGLYFVRNRSNGMILKNLRWKRLEWFQWGKSPRNVFKMQKKTT